MRRFAFFLVAWLFIWACPGLVGAVDFKAKGQWLMNFSVGPTSLVESSRVGNTTSKPAQELFNPSQRIRLQLEAVASENLSGTVQIQIGATNWGRASQGAALGADGTNVIKIHQAYLDWVLPFAGIKTRMGLQTLTLPNAAGGPVVLNGRVGAIVSSWKASNSLTLTCLWARPFNDNYPGYTRDGQAGYHQNYLDNLDLFGLVADLRFDGLRLSPWVMYGIRGKNTLWNAGDPPSLQNYGTQGNDAYTLYPWPALMSRDSATAYSPFGSDKDYGSLFWAGMPVVVKTFDPWNMELDLNYGYAEGIGRYDAYKGAVSPQNIRRSSTTREGWLVKALVEYKFDWGIPGVYGWYSSGDDGNPKNGSERMPSICAYQRFTTFMGNTPYTLGNYYNNSLDYAGTWGIGLRAREISLVENLKHTLAVTWWGGTNSPSMVKYMPTAYSWNNGMKNWDGPYLTTNDGLLEANLITTWKMYDNLTVYGELGYIANFMDNSTWKKAGAQNSSFSRQDMWKIELAFSYDF